ncbi:MAG: flagellar filament capping protein FliD [Burkholderiales bacterium]|nr:flagellar filament capping protein FliD [Burkholderiales bacterium]
MAISAPGLGSNLDVNGLVTQLMAAEKKPIEALNIREASIQAKLSAFGSIKGSLSSLKSALASLRETARFSGFRASVGDSAIASVSVSGQPAVANYSLEVTTLAQAQKLKSAAFASSTETVGSGTITIQFGKYESGAFTLNADKPTQSITIDPADGSLAGVRDAINKANAGVTANLVNDGTGQRLVLSARDSGASNALRITVDDADGNHTDASGLSQLAYDASTGGTQRLAQTIAAQDAAFLLDGIAITKSSNTVSDALEGVTLQLNKTNAGSPTTLAVTKDTGATTSAVEAFVKAWNDGAKTLRDLSAYNAATKQGAILQGDATVLAIQSQMRGVLGAALGDVGTLSDLGIAFESNGNLSLNSSKLASAIAAGRNIASFFAVTGTTTDNLIQFASADDNATAGALGVQITQAATRGTAAGGAAAALTITAGVNDALVMKVDGTEINVTLGAGTYTAGTLAAELQSRINGALASGSARVAVTQNAGVLTVTSNRYGSASMVELSGGNALADLFGAPVATAGVDVAGSIGGVTGAGSGQKLTAAGISIDVQGAAGDRGTLNFSRGYADQLSTLVDKLLASDGSITSRTDGINATIKDIGSRRERMNERLATVEKRYRAQFIALDTMISRMTQTSSFLQNQLSNLPKAGQ